MESIKSKGKRNCTSACALVDEAVSHGVYGLTILKILSMYARTIKEAIDRWWEPGFSVLEWEVMDTQEKKMRSIHNAIS